MKTLFKYTQDKTSGRWLVVSKPLKITVESDTKEEMILAVADAIRALMKSGKKYGDTQIILNNI